MLSFNRVFTFVTLMTLPVSVMAIDCSKATLKDDTAICASPYLMQLDAVLNKSYALARKHSDKELLKNQQLSWLKERQQCSDDLSCLGNSYISRISKLASVDNVSVIHTASKQWDFVLSVSGCNQDKSYPTCEGPGMLDIFTKDTGKLVQHLQPQNIFIELDSKGKATTNLVEMYGDNNSGLVVDDINFDGFDDIALRTGNEGAYGGPSYEVLLYKPKSNNFVKNDALTQLGSENLGLFDIDPQSRTLTTSTKSGCCWHQSRVWEINNDQPVLIEEITEAAGSGNNQNTMMITTRKLVNGQWQTTEKKAETSE